MTPAQKNAVNRHRERQAQKGFVRLELNVPGRDKETLRRVAAELRKGGFDAERLRVVLASALNGEELINFKKYLEMAPLEGVELERSKDTGLREIDF